MLISRTCSALVMCLVVSLISLAAPANASDCETVTLPNGTTIIDCSNSGGGGSGGGNGGGGNGGEGGGDSTTCTYRGQEVPCSTDDGVWTGQCYAKAMDPQPPESSPWWDGNEDGVIVECTPPAICSSLGGGLGGCAPQIYWAAGPPEATGPSPRELADRAVAQMQLTMGEIGSTPPSTEVKADSMGVVGLPLWLWVANPAPNTTGPITESASGGAITVTATAELDRIEWTYTNRQTGAVVHTLTCSGNNASGTPWTASTRGDGKRPSPTCGIPGNQNSAAGRYTLTGTAHWVVEWNGGGQSGTITVPAQSNSVPVDIGELQVLLTD